MAGSQSVNDVLRRLHTSFRSYLNFQSISPHLRLHELLTDHEWEVISNKDNRQDQVDEFLKVLPLKGSNCLNQLIECLQSSLDHAGHKDLLVELKKQVGQQSGSDISQSLGRDEVDKAVNTINSLHSTYMEQIELIDTMNAKLEEQNKEIEQLNTKCNDQTRSLLVLKSVVATKNSEIYALNSKLQESLYLLESMRSIANGSESDVPMENDCFKMSGGEKALHENVRAPSHSFSFSAGEHHEAPSNVKKRTLSDIPHLSKQNAPIEEKLKAYQEDLAKYCAKCKLLEQEKEKLNRIKNELESEVSQLKEALEAASIGSHGSGLTRYSQSCSSLTSIGKEADKGTQLYSQQGKVKISESRLFFPGLQKTSFANFAAYFNLKKITNRRPSKCVRPPPETLETSMEHEKPVTLPDNMSEDYINPLCQGWLSKEGGNKKHWENRWCVLSSRFFFYFERQEDPAANKRPIGILPITTEMEVTDCKTGTLFAIYNKTRSLMKSCKLDKSRLNYVEGNHDVYNLQAPSDEEKNNWIKFFQLLVESLNKTESTN